MNFIDARKVMVESQLMPNGIDDGNILDAFSNIPKQMFLPEQYQSVCYKDESIVLSNKRAIIDPVTLAKLISHVDIQKSDVVLCLGDISGYASSVVSQLASTVLRVEEDVQAIEFSESVYHQLEIMNIVSINAPLSEGAKANAPFDKIILCGASSEIPTNLVKQLTDSGVITYVHKENDMATGEIITIKRKAEGDDEVTKHGASSAPYCLGYQLRESFAL